MNAKSEYLQIRLTPAQKTAVKRLARQSGQDMSSYVLSRIIPHDRERFDGLIRALEAGGDRRFALAELNDVLSRLAPARLLETVGQAELRDLPPLDQNYVAAMVEQAADRKGVEPPAWTRDVVPLETPWFATPVKSLRVHLLRSAPVPFKRRNLFVDASVGDRV
ncbi:MAG TPA: hypothetical protein VMK65_05450 [Longimicrobiales bacterium]|nr:hypothetical protein [Longimicrobiales bacterium]